MLICFPKINGIIPKADNTIFLKKNIRKCPGKDLKRESKLIRKQVI